MEKTQFGLFNATQVGVKNTFLNITHASANASHKRGRLTRSKTFPLSHGESGEETDIDSEDVVEDVVTPPCQPYLATPMDDQYTLGQLPCKSLALDDVLPHCKEPDFSLPHPSYQCVKFLE